MTMPRPLPPVDESHQIMLKAFEALRSTENQGRQGPCGRQRRRASLRQADGSHRPQPLSELCGLLAEGRRAVPDQRAAIFQRGICLLATVGDRLVEEVDVARGAKPG
jgi:hypothetical protein